MYLMRLLGNLKDAQNAIIIFVINLRWHHLYFSVFKVIIRVTRVQQIMLKIDQSKHIAYFGVSITRLKNSAERLSNSYQGII